MTLPRPALWVPRKYLQDEREQLARRGTETPLRVALGYQEVFGVEPSWDQLLDRIRQYSLPQVLGCLGRISGVLEQLERSHAEGQKRICDGLFGERSGEVWRAVLEWLRRERLEGGPPSTPTLFHELQVITLAKVALLELEVGERGGLEHFEPLAEALLMINNLQGGVLGNNPAADPSTAEGMRIWHQHFIANGLFHHGDTDAHTFPRAYDLYLTDKPHLRDDPSYVNLPSLIRDLTGLEPDTLWFVLFAFMAHWRTIEPEAIASGTWAMDRTQYFSSLNFSKQDVNAFFGLACLNATEMQREVRSLYSVESLRPFHVLPFARSPLIQIDDHVFCVSVRLLKQKLTGGLHHLFLDQEHFSTEERKRYLDFMGAVFEDYVARLLDRVYPASAHRWIGPKELAASVHGRSCDFAILYGDALVLVEAKATRFTLAARTEESWSEYERQFNDIFLDGASQIDNTIREIEGGRLLHLGIDPAIVRAYYPLVVTLEDLPMTRPIYQKVLRDLAQASLLNQEKVRPLQAIDVGELEFLEIGLHAGRSIRDILQQKLTSEDDQAQSMGNYLLGRNEAFMRGPVNEYLGTLFNELGDRGLETFRAHKEAARS